MAYLTGVSANAGGRVDAEPFVSYAWRHLLWVRLLCLCYLPTVYFTFGPSKRRTHACAISMPAMQYIHSACLTGRGVCIHVSHTFNTGYLPLNYSSNPGVNVSDREGCRR
jgi:hypothetical protein